MGMSPLAGRAIAASRKRADNHRIANFEALDLIADGRNPAGHFMADDPVGSDTGIHGTVKYMQITTANPTIGYTCLHFALDGLNWLHGLNRKAFISGVICCFHKFFDALS
jgi:hypothetical protein